MRGKKLIGIKAALAALALAAALPSTIGAAFSEDAQPPAASNPSAGAADKRTAAVRGRPPR